MNTPALAPVLPTPAPSPAAPGTPAPRDGEPSAFARELKSATAGSGGDAAEPQAEPAREAAADEARADGRSSEAGDPPARPGQTSTQRATLDRWLAMARVGGADRAVDDAEAPTDSSADGEPATVGLRSVVDEATAPEAAALLAALMPRQPDDKAAAESGTRGDEGQAAEADDLLAVEPRPAPGAAQQAALAARVAAGRGDDAAAAGTLQALQAPEGSEAGGVAAGAAGLAEGLAAGSPAGTPSAAPSALPSFAAELARAGQAVAGAAGSTPASDVSLPTPVHSPDFMPRLSGELAVLARDGVQEARVHVNPAELGPIAVQITLDGSAAQVRLAVEHAQTRDLLEQGMPTLAAALRENGLTLTGGGVFQQARDPGRDAQGGQDASARGGTSDRRDGGRDGGRDPLAASAPARRVRHPGQVDVYA